MKIAYLMMCHKDPAQIKRLTERLLKTGDVIIHVDKKSDITPFIELLKNEENVYFVKNRIDVSYAGFTMAKVYLEMLEYAYNSEKGYDRFVFMTGQDYPLMKDSEIIEEFSSHKDTEYIMAYKIATSTIPTDKNKVECKWYLDTKIHNKFLRRCYLSIMYRVFTKHGIRRKRQVPFSGKLVEPYFGQMLSAFTRQGAKLLIDTYRNDKKFNKVMKHVYPAVEIYWQTVIFNSPLREKTIQNGEEHEITTHFGWAPLHFHHYDVDTSVFTEKDFDEIVSSKMMFFRKAIPGISDALLDKIDKYREE